MLSSVTFTFTKACPLCDADRRHFQVITRGGRGFSQEAVVICRRCGLVFLNPRMSEASLDNYYRADVFSCAHRGDASPDCTALEYRDTRASRRWERLQGVLPMAGRCLEIGCSCGSFLQVLSARGFSVAGIDPSTGYAKYARERGIDVTVGNFPDDIPPPGHPYEVIAAFHVLEHVANPRRFLAAVRERIAAHGILVLEYPDVSRAVRRQKLASTYFQQSHLYDFTFTTICALLHITGFQVQHVFTEGIAPYDKNVLVVACPISPIEVTAWEPESADQLLRQIQHKLRQHKFAQLRRIMVGLTRRLGLYVYSRE